MNSLTVLHFCWISNWGNGKKINPKYQTYLSRYLPDGKKKESKYRDYITIVIFEVLAILSGDVITKFVVEAKHYLLLSKIFRVAQFYFLSIFLLPYFLFCFLWPSIPSIT